MLKRLWIVLTAIFLIFCGVEASSAPVYATQQGHATDELVVAQRWQQLDQYSEQLYQQSVRGELLVALETMRKMEQVLIEAGTFDQMSVEKVEAITSTVISVKGELHRVQLQQQQLVHATSKLRLVMDAVTHPKKAMWLQYEQVLQQEMSDLLQATTKAEWDQRSKEWMTHIDRILPAVMMQRPVETVEMIRSLMELVEQTNSSNVDMEQAKSALRDAEEMWMTALFGKRNDAATWARVGEYGVPWTFVMWLGCIVSVSLAYVGYIKYRQQDEEIHRGPWRSIS